MTPELRRLETEIFYDRSLRRIDAIREAWAAYVKTLEPPDSLGRRLVDWLNRKATPKKKQCKQSNRGME